MSTHTHAHIHKALENVGMVMVFTLVSAVQEKLGELVEAVKEELDRERERREEEGRKGGREDGRGRAGGNGKYTFN